ncbi:NAD-reducing hydrogenase small subunit [Rhodobacter sp. JA431]|uniref:NADH-quinone oxidoreductase subunit B family protein n=1 Tax=Rhodobacter sp. JA431 TaxID=570013 RepID=UPI000BD0130B|nr:NADP oxidoreductase [Rhodobacter sp. JA431]SOB89933.1 NAD-reducing hydrogenase small subunit [Rhodobacter sp. JA431]
MQAPTLDRSPETAETTRKLRVATASLSGCFGCHMSLLDIDARITELVKLVEFDRSPLTDIKTCGPCDIGLVEGAVANSENVHVLRELRANCQILIALGACAVNGGLPAQRNHLDVGEMLEDVYRDIDEGLPCVPDAPELPLLLDRVRPVNEVVRVDYFIPGCPPSGDTLWKYLTDLIGGRMPRLDYDLFRYD